MNERNKATFNNMDISPNIDQKKSDLTEDTNCASGMQTVFYFVFWTVVTEECSM